MTLIPSDCHQCRGPIIVDVDTPGPDYCTQACEDRAAELWTEQAQASAQHALSLSEEWDQ